MPWSAGRGVDAHRPRPVVARAVTDLSFHVVAPAIGLSGCGAGARVRAARLQDSNGGHVRDANRLGTVGGRTVPELAERIPPPTIHLARDRGRARMHGPGSDR